MLSGELISRLAGDESARAATRPETTESSAKSSAVLDDLELRQASWVGVTGFALVTRVAAPGAERERCALGHLCRPILFDGTEPMAS
jgi:hypothetical protein